MISTHPEPGDLAARFMAGVESAKRDELIAELSSLLCAEQQTGKVKCTYVAPPKTGDLAARIFTVKDSGGDPTTIFFNITDAALETALPIVGIFLTLLFAKPTPETAVSIASVAKSMWSHVVSLSVSRDAVALEVLRTIGAIRASRFAGFPEDRIVAEEFPSTEQICTRIQGLSDVQVCEGLKRLEAIRLIECKNWGDQKGDLSHKANRWGERL